MSKLAYIMVTLVGAVPAGFVNYLLVMHFLDRGLTTGTTVIQVLVWSTLAATFLIAISPFIVLFGYKETASDVIRSAAPKSGKGKNGDEDDELGITEKPKKKSAASDDGFEDAIPEDFDEDELRASEKGDDDEGLSGDDMGDDYSEEAAFDEDGDFDYSEDAVDDFSEALEEEEEEPQPKKKGKK